MRQDGAIAQLVEQRTENPCVPGSIPGGTTCKNSQNVLKQRFGSFSFALKPKIGYNLDQRKIGSTQNSEGKHHAYKLML